MTRPLTQIGNEVREMTDDELEQYEKDKLAAQVEAEAKVQAKAEAEAKRSAALAKLEALGLDEDDLKALGLQAQSPKIMLGELKALVQVAKPRSRQALVLTFHKP